MQKYYENDFLFNPRYGIWGQRRGMIFSEIVCCLEFWGLFRSFLNARARRDSVGCWLVAVVCYLAIRNTETRN